MRFDTNGTFYFCGIVLYSLDPKLMNEGLFGYGHGLTIVYRLTSLTLNPSPPISTHLHPSIRILKLAKILESTDAGDRN